MNLFGEHDPTGGDGYVPGAWDQVRTACLEGHITMEAYEVLRLHVNPPGSTAVRPGSIFERPPGNVYPVPDGFPLESTERPKVTVDTTFDLQDTTSDHFETPGRLRRFARVHTDPLFWALFFAALLLVVGIVKVAS